MIAMRGLQLLREGGLMAYSTCSFNPLENEAVVAELLRRCGGAVELVDVSAALPGLLRSPGLFTWRVFDGGMGEHASYEASQLPDMEGGRMRRPPKRLLPSMFPPASEAAARAGGLHLDRCMRMLPHAQDTGGFFIALLRKTGPLPLTARGNIHLKAEKAQAQEKVRAAHAAASAAAAPALEPEAGGAGGASLEPAAAAEGAAAAAADNDAAAAATGGQPASAAAGEGAPSAAAPSTAGGSSSSSSCAGHKREREEAHGGLEAPGAGEGAGEQEEEDDDEEEDEEDEESNEQDAEGGGGAALEGGVTAAAAAAATDSAAAAGAGAGAAASAAAGAGTGRTFRDELSVYRAPDAASMAALVAQFGLHALFPSHLLLSRSDANKNIVVSGACARTKLPVGPACPERGGRAMGPTRQRGPRSLKTTTTTTAALPRFPPVPAAEPIVRSCIPRAKQPDGRGALKIVNTGVKVLEANPTPPQPGHIYRIPQDGVQLMAPYLSRGIVYASAAELHTVLRFRGQQVPPTMFSPRLRAAMEHLAVGSFVLALAPALDGCDGPGPDAALPQAYPPPPPGWAAPSIHDVMDVIEGGKAIVPKAVVPRACSAAIPPALRVHYQDGEAAADGASSSSAAAAAAPLVFAPKLRAWTGSAATSRVLVAMWKGRGR